MQELKVSKVIRSEINILIFCVIFVGIGICVQPLYLGEIAPTALRGMTGMGTSVFITIGILSGQVMGLT